MTTEAKSLSDWANDSVPVVVTHRGRTFTVNCFPERLTKALYEKARAESRDFTLFGEIVEGWTLEEPWCEETVREMNKGLKLSILDAIRDENENPTLAASAKDSPSSSSAAATTASAPAGT
jgi:hypothetical protein